MQAITLPVQGHLVVLMASSVTRGLWGWESMPLHICIGDGVDGVCWMWLCKSP